MTQYKLIDTDANPSGTSLKGHIEANYHDLVEVFGEPKFMGDRDGFSDKVWTEWSLEFENEEGDMIISTIYDWKEQGPFVSREAAKYRWHIGGNSGESAWAVDEYFKEKMNA